VAEIDENVAPLLKANCKANESAWHSQESLTFTIFQNGQGHPDQSRCKMLMIMGCPLPHKKLPFPQKNELGFVTQAAGRGVRGVG
jgi:hypothetical protein